jgi:hypothetical protein
MDTVGQCKLCAGYYRMNAQGRLPEHLSIKTGNPCRGRWPVYENDYPIGWDYDPWVASAGLPTLGKKR